MSALERLLVSSGTNIQLIKNDKIQINPNHRISRRDENNNLESTDSILNSINNASDKFEHNEEFELSDGSVGNAREMDKMEHRSEDSDRDAREEEERLAASDINWGVTILGNSIRFVSAIFTILGGDSVDRVDGYDTAVNSFFTLGGSILKYFSSKILSNDLSNPFSKIDVSSLSPEELLQKQQIAEYIATLSPDQIKEQQDMVLKHVQKEAIKDGLSEQQAQQLLVATLENNGLPLIEGLSPSDPEVDLLAPLAGLVSGAGGFVNNLLGNNVEKLDNSENFPGLPTPGTFEYAVTMALFQANEGLNSFLSGFTGGGGPQVQVSENGPSNKVELASQPNILTGALSQIASFFSSGSSSQGGSDDVSSSVAISVNPTALIGAGVIATGLLGGVAYGYSSNRRSDLATSATSFAKGAVDALKNNPIVRKLEDTISSITGNSIESNTYVEKKDPGPNPYVFYPDYDSGYTGAYSTDYQGYEDPRVENYQNLVEYHEYDVDYEDPREQVQEYNVDYEDPQEQVQKYNVDYVDPREQVRAPVEQEPERDNFTREDALNHKINQAIPSRVQFYEYQPDIHKQVDVITYEEKHNPWNLLYNGQSTQHLYRRNFQ